MSEQQRVTVPDWVAAAVAGPGRVPVGHVVAGCRWPVGMGERVAGGLDTLASIAAAEFPMVCLACRTPHRIDALTDNPNPGARALDSAACPSCGTVGLWPPTRPLREIEWANRELWAAYGATMPLPADQVVMVPELCGLDVTQRSDHGAQPTYCGTAPTGGQAHVGAKADRPRDRLVAAHAPAVVVPARPDLVVVPDPAEPEPADTATAKQRTGGPAESTGEPVEPASGHAEPPAAEVGELVSGEVLEGVRAELAIAARLLGDATARVTRAVGQYDQLADALGQERRALTQRAADAEAAATAARAELESARAAAEAAEQGRLRAEGRADELAAQLTSLRDGAIQQVLVSAMDRFGARRTVAGERITPTQRKMIDAIGGSGSLVWRDVVGGTWSSEGRTLTDGTVKTLDSLHKRGLIGWGATNADNSALVGLTGVAVELYTSRHGQAPRYIPGVSETTPEQEASPATEPADDAAAEAAAAEVDGEPGEPGEPVAELSEVPPVPELAALEAQGEPAPTAVAALLRRVRGGGVSRGADRIWRFTGDVIPDRPTLAALDWMLTQGMIQITDSDAVEPTTPF